MKHDDRYIVWDFIRGVSALIVCSTHLRAAMFTSFSELESSSLFDKIFYFLTGFGHQAVIVFFVLSGFFVGGSILKSIDKFNMKQYLIARLSRLWVVLLPMLALTYVIDSIIATNLPQLLNGEHLPTLNSGPSSDYSISTTTLLSNILFLQTIFSPVYGSNGPLWSLANEFWYYMLFPLLLIVFGRLRGTWAPRVLCLLLVVIILAYATPSILEGFVIWLMGVAVFILLGRNSERTHVRAKLISGSLFAVALIDSKLHLIHSFLHISSDILISICFSLFLLCLNTSKFPSMIRHYFTFVGKWLSEISFTMYLAHFPIVMLIYTYGYKNGQVVLSFDTLLIYFAWLLVIVITSFCLWFLFEKHTSKARYFISKLANLK